MNDILQRIFESEVPEVADLEQMLALTDAQDLQSLFSYADGVRKQYMGDGILLRGIVEFSNHCRNTCYYCGLNKNNKDIKRYALSIPEIIESVRLMHSSRIKTVVLQSGEDDSIEAGWLAEVIKEIKRRFDMAIALCVGERTSADYKLWKETGADRYLLKIETTNTSLYEFFHPGMSFDNRVRCLHDLQSMGYQTGSGNIIGLKNQTVKDIAGDIVFFKKENFEMIGIGPFIPHERTQLAGQRRGDISLTLKTLALTRIVTKNAHLPATTALGSQEKDYRIEGLQAGANVLMPNFTPMEYKKLYEIYPGKRCISEFADSCIGCMEEKALSIGRSIDYARGDSLKRVHL